MRVEIDKERIVFTIIHVYKVYSSFSKNYKTIYDKRSLLIIKTTLYILSENVLIKNSNLYYAT